MITHRAHAITSVRAYLPISYDTPKEGPALSRLHVEETLTGDIEASNAGVRAYDNPYRSINFCMTTPRSFANQPHA